MIKKVFILGSGFSKAVKNYFLTLSELKRQIFSLFDKSDNQALKAHLETIPVIIYDDLEQLLSYLYSDYPWKSNTKLQLDRALYYELINCINKHFKENMSGNWADIWQCANNGELKHFFNFIHFQKIPVITFNYDMLFESLYLQLNGLAYFEYKKEVGGSTYFYRIHVESPYSVGEIKTSCKSPIHFESSLKGKGLYKNFDVYIYQDFLDFNKNKFRDEMQVRSNNVLDRKDNDIIWKQIFGKPKYTLNLKSLYQHPMKSLESRIFDNYSHENIPEVANLLKLHGSVDWYYSESDYQNSDIYYLDSYNTKPDETGAGKSKDQDNKIIDSLFMGVQPLIIPPILDKSFFYSNNILQGIWKRAGAYLNNADEIYIIGYGLPMSDLALKHFLQENIKSTTKLYIINCSENTNKIVKDYKAAFPRDKDKLNFEYCSDDENKVLKSFIENKIMIENIAVETTIS